MTSAARPSSSISIPGARLGGRLMLQSVDTHRDAVAEGVGRVLRHPRDRYDLAACVIAYPQRLFERVLIRAVEMPVPAREAPAVRINPQPDGLGWNLFHADSLLHVRHLRYRSSASLCASRITI